MVSPAKKCRSLCRRISQQQISDYILLQTERRLKGGKNDFEYYAGAFMGLFEVLCVGNFLVITLVIFKKKSLTAFWVALLKNSDKNVGLVTFIFGSFLSILTDILVLPTRFDQIDLVIRGAIFCGLMLPISLAILDFFFTPENKLKRILRD